MYIYIDQWHCTQNTGICLSVNPLLNLCTIPQYRASVGVTTTAMSEIPHYSAIFVD
jgi:hypothetical protein